VSRGVEEHDGLLHHEGASQQWACHRRHHHAHGRNLADLSEKEMRLVRGDEVALIPGPADLAEPDEDNREPDRRGDQVAPGCLTRRGRARALEVLTLVEMPRPAERSINTPTSFRAGCANAS